MKYRFFIIHLLMVVVLGLAVSTTAVKADYDAALNLYKEKKYTEAISLLEQWCEKYPKDPREAYLLAQCYRNTKQNQKAIDRLEIILQHHPDADNCRFLLGSLLLPTSPVEATKHFQKAVQVDPENAQYNYYLGSALMAQKKYSEAETPLRKAVSVTPGNVRAQLDLGKVLLLNNKAEEAVKHLKVAIKGENKASALYFLGLAQIQSKDFNGAVSTLTDAVNQTPNDARLYYNLGLARESLLGDQTADLEKYQPIIDAYEKAVSLNNDVEDYKFRLGNAYETAVRNIYDKITGNDTLKDKALDYLAKARKAFESVNSDSARQRIAEVDQIIDSVKNPIVIEEEVPL